MLKPGQDLPLLQETTQDEVGIHAPLDELERDVMLKLAVDAFGEVDRPHAAPPQFAHEAIGCDAPPERRGFFVQGLRLAQRVEQPLGQGMGGLIEERACLFVGSQKQLHLCAQRGVGTGLVEEGGAVFGRQLQRLIEHVFDPLPLFGGGRGHGLGVRFSLRYVFFVRRR